MDVGFGMFFIILGFVFFIIGLYEELAHKNTEEDEEKSDNAIIIFLFIAIIGLVFGGITLLYASETYYSAVTDTVEEVLLESYRPFGYGIIIFSFIPMLMEISKVFSVLGSGEAE